MIIPARSEHLKAINNIYNQAVLDGLRTAHTNPLSLKKRRQWFQRHSPDQHPVFVYMEGEEVLGWISISPYRREREALDEVVEVSYYVHYDHHGEGIATSLMEQAITFCNSAGYRILVAVLIDGNESSIKLLKKFSFREGGRIPDAVHYEDEFRDHLYMYKNIS